MADDSALFARSVEREGSLRATATMSCRRNVARSFRTPLVASWTTGSMCDRNKKQCSSSFFVEGAATLNLSLSPAGSSGRVSIFMDPTEITRHLIDAARQRPTILGSHLGAALSALPGLRNDPQFPGLKRFIQAYCADRIVRIGDHGGDDEYQFVPEGETAPTIPLRAPLDPWTVFQYPTADGELYVNITNSNLEVRENSDASSEGFALIPKVTREEHRAIAQAFIERIDESKRWEFQQALVPEHYWPPWSKLVNKLPYKSDWNTFRFDRLCELFRVRLRGHGLNETLVSAGLNHLLREKKSSSERAPMTEGSSHLLRTDFHNAEGSPNSLRAVIHAAIDGMGDNELRRVWLPLGDVLDALKRSRR